MAFFDFAASYRIGQAEMGLRACGASLHATVPVMGVITPHKPSVWSGNINQLFFK